MMRPAIGECAGGAKAEEGRGIDAGKEWFNTKEAAEVMGLTVSGMKAMVFRGKIKPDHRGGRDGLKGHRFHRRTLEAFLGRPLG